MSATNCCVPYQGSARCYRVLCSRSCLNWECLIASRSPHWPVWHHLTATVENYAAVVVSGVDAHRSGASCIWRRWRQFAAILPSELSICGCIASGKHAKPALVASMRKFLVILNAMPRNSTHWQTPALISPTSRLSPSWARSLNTVAASIQK